MLTFTTSLLVHSLGTSINVSFKLKIVQSHHVFFLHLCSQQSMEYVVFLLMFVAAAVGSTVAVAITVVVLSLVVSF